MQSGSRCWGPDSAESVMKLKLNYETLHTTPVQGFLGLTLVVTGIAQMALSFQEWAQYVYRSAVMPELTLVGSSDGFGRAKFTEFGDYAIAEGSNRAEVGFAMIAIGAFLILAGLFLGLPGSRWLRVRQICTVLAGLGAVTTLVITFLAARDPASFFGSSQSYPRAGEFTVGPGLMWTAVVALLTLVVACVAAASWLSRNLGTR